MKFEIGKFYEMNNRFFWVKNDEYGIIVDLREYVIRLARVDEKLSNDNYPDLTEISRERFVETYKGLIYQIGFFDVFGIDKFDMSYVSIRRLRDIIDE